MQPPLEARARNVLHSESRKVVVSLRLGHSPAHAVAVGLMSVIDRHTPPALYWDRHVAPIWARPHSVGQVSSAVPGRARGLKISAPVDASPDFGTLGTGIAGGAEIFHPSFFRPPTFHPAQSQIFPTYF